MQRDLVIQARDGDLDAFTQLVRLSGPRLESVAYLILNDTDQAKDALQEALVKAWRDMGALRDPDAWDAWIRRLTVNYCLQIARKDKRRVALEQRVGRERGPGAVEDHSNDLAQRDWILRELGRIDIDQRAVIVLHYYLALPMREVAEVLRIPFGTAASRLHRGLEAMRASMDVAGVGPEEVATEHL